MTIVSADSIDNSPTAEQSDVQDRQVLPTDLPYVPLSIHSHYSLLEAASKINDIVAIGKSYGMSAMGLTDSGVMFGVVAFYNACMAAGIKPIIGCELYVVDGDITDRNSRQLWYHLPLICKNLTGYQNLVKLVSIAQLEGFYYKPRVNWQLIEQYKEGLIALSGDMAGAVARPILRGNPQQARDYAQKLKTIFVDDFYLELQNHGKEMEQRLCAETIAIGKELDIPLVITNGSRFSRPEDHDVHKILLCMQDGKTLEESSRTEFYGPEFYIKNRDQVLQPYGQQFDPTVIAKAMANTAVIADKCHLEIPMGQSLLPVYPLENGVTEAEELRRITRDFAIKKYGDPLPVAVQTRMDLELDIIAQMGFPAYFLIVWDFIHYARTNGIPVGPGRGSAAGSLVAYVLGITNIDPIEHNLLFERFLNPERISMPDIDIDFCIDRREEVIDYVRQKYGAERVCQIATFGTLAARAAIKAVCRVMNVPFADSDRLAKMVPAMPGTKLKDALADGMELAKEVQSNPDSQKIVDLALKIEGTACNIGVHAAGVVIAKDPLEEVVPIQHSKDKQVVSQFTMGELEQLGLLKMDFLGLRNLTIIYNAVKLIKTTQGVQLDIDAVPLDDSKVYDMLTAGDTDGVFQLESSGMKSLVRNLKPSTFEDINALVALYRPGPLNSGMVDQFVNRKHGREAVKYQHPSLEPLLNSTYGTIVYQEQIMQIAQTLAGYSLGQADLLRRAMGKKKAEVMEKERAGFLAGCQKNNVDDAIANDLFDKMSEFAAYCFNRSHSAAYAFVAYQTAYLKAHFPVEYFSALISSVSNDLDKIQFYILACRRMGIAILPPDVHRSGANFTPDGTSIRFGLASVKNVGTGVVEDIVKAREEKPFESLEDFLKRVDPKILNRKTLESLVLVGAFDRFGLTRQKLYNNVETLIQFGQRVQQQRETGQASLFDLIASQGAAETNISGLMLVGADDEFAEEDYQRYEKDLLGFYVSSHPLDSVAETLPLMVTHQVVELKAQNDGQAVVIGGLLSSIQRRMTKKGQPMAIATVEDVTGSTEVVIFNSTLEKLGEQLVDGSRVIIQGKVSFRGDDNENYSVIVDDVRPLKEVQLLNLRFTTVPRYEDVAFLSRILAENRGLNPVIIHLADGTRIKTGSNFWVGAQREAIQSRIQNHFGAAVQFVA